MPLKIGDVLKGRYTIREVIDQGGFSVVYRAYDRLYARDVAIKEFILQLAGRFDEPPENLKARFQREALFAAQLRHPHIIEIYDVIFDDTIDCIIMPYLPETLAHHLEQMPYLEVAEATRIMMQICDGLAYVHRFCGADEAAVHCDIKPGNILFDKDTVKITDFGIAHLPSEVGGVSLKTVLFGAGSIRCMAPEQLSGERKYPQIDVYAAGALFYLMLTGRNYLDFETANTWEAQERNGRKIRETAPFLGPLREKNVPQPLIEIIRKALAKPIADRYAHAGEMLAALEAAQQALGGTPPALEQAQALKEKIATPQRSRVELAAAPNKIQGQHVMSKPSGAIVEVDSESTSQLGPGETLENGLGLDHAVTSTGIGSTNSKENNEDDYWPHPEDGSAYHLIDYLIAGRLYVVADGVSGELRGDEASQLATKTIAETYYEEVFKLEHYPEEAELVAALKTALLRADQTLLKESQNRHSQADSTDTGGYLQTTAICAVLRGERLILASVGDSRCYRLRKNEMDRTNPPQVDLLRVEASGEENKFFLGANLRPSQISLFSQALTPEDMLLLCTDGLYKYLAPDNDPKSTPIMIQDNWGYYSSGGIQRLGYELFSQADDPTTYGGQDNITLLLVEPPQPAAMPVNEAIEQWAAFAWWNVDQLWRFEGSGSAAREKLQALCHKQAQSFSRAGNPAEREMWEHRAKQLGSTVSSGWAEFQRARELYEKLGLDFRENRKNVVTIFALYDQTSENSDLRQLGLHAVTDLANLALMSYPDNGEFLWDVYRLFDPFYTRVAPNIAEEEKETALKILKQVALNLSRAAIILVKGNANDNLDNRTVDVYAKSMVGTIIRYRDQGVYSLTYTQFIDVLKTEKMPVLSKVPPTSSLAFSVEPIASPDVKPENSQLSLPTTQLVDDEVASPYTPKKSQSIMRNLLLVVFLIMAIGFGRIVILQLLNGNTLLATVLRGTPTPVTTNEPVTVTLLPTKTATPVPTTTPTPTPTPVLEGTPIPTVIGPISPDNAKFVAPLAEWGTKNQEPIYSIAISPNGSLLASGNAQGEIQLRWMENGNIQAVLEKNTQSVECVTFSESGERLLASLKDNTAHLWRVNDRTLLEDRRYAGTLINCGFWNNGVILAYQDARNAVYLRAITAGYTLKKGEYLRLESNVHVRSIAYSPSGTVVALGTWQGMQLWQIVDYRPEVLHNLVKHIGWVGAITFSADGKLIASGGADPNDHTIQVWDVYSARHLTTLDGHTNNINDLAFSPDGMIIASASDDQSVRLWRVSDGELLHTLKGHADSVNSIVFSPDGMILASGSTDGTVRLWGMAQQ